MPPKCETKEQLIARNAYRMKSHHRKVDNIAKLGALFLGEKAKSMELKDILDALREEFVRRNPGHHNRNNGTYLCRTLEYDDVRASVWVSSNMSENCAIFDKKIAELKQEKEMAEAKVRAKMLKSKQMEHQPDELEEYLFGEPHEETMEVDIDEAEDLETMPAKDIDRDTKRYRDSYGTGFDVNTFNAQFPDAVNEEIDRRRPGLQNGNSGWIFRRTLEYDGVRASVLVSSDMSENRARFDKKNAKLKQEKEMAEAKDRAKMIKSEQNKKIMEMIESKSVKPREMDTDEAEDPETMPATRKIVPMRYQPRGSEEYLHGEETMEIVDEVFEEPQQMLREIVPLGHQPDGFQAILHGEPQVDTMATLADEPQMPVAKELPSGKFKAHGKLKGETDVNQIWQKAKDEIAFWDEQIQEHDRDFKRFKASINVDTCNNAEFPEPQQ